MRSSTKITSEYLTRERELELVLEMRAGSEEAMHRLVLAHRPLVLSYAQRYQRYGARKDDLVSEGWCALMVAARRFDPAFGTRFATYAHWWLRYYMMTFLHNTHSIVRPAMGRAVRKARQKLVGKTHELTGTLGREPSLAELAEVFGTTPDAIRRVQLERVHRDIPVGARESSDAVYEPVDPCDVEGTIAANQERRTTAARLSEAYARLEPREREILDRRFGEDSETLRDIGATYGVSRERIRQIEAAALRKLRAMVGGSGEEALDAAE